MVSQVTGGQKRHDILSTVPFFFKKKDNKCAMLSGCMPLHLGGDTHIPAALLSSALLFDGQHTPILAFLSSCGLFIDLHSFTGQF